VASHFDAIGFGVAQDRINDLLNDALMHGTKIPVSSDTSYSVWRPGGGPELWVGIRESGASKDLLALTPYFRGPSRLRVRIEGVEGGDSQYPFEGRIAVWAIPRGQDDQEYPFSIDLADYALLGDLAVGKELNMPIAGSPIPLNGGRTRRAIKLPLPICSSHRSPSFRSACSKTQVRHHRLGSSLGS